MIRPLMPFILFIVAIHASMVTAAQCPGGIYWKNGISPGGTLRDTGVVMINDTVYVRTTTPTLGSFASGRPGYITGSVSWGTNSFQSIGLYRGGGVGATTRFVFKTPLDSNHIHFRIWDIRGDGFNTEHQLIRGYRNGVQVSATFKDPVNGVVIVAGEQVRGAPTTSSTVQSASRIFFNQAVDSVIVSSTGFSDYVILELFARCDIVLADETIRLQATRSGAGVVLNWNYRGANIGKLSLQRSPNGTHWADIGSLPFGPGRFEDSYPLEGLNHYRVAHTDISERSVYSNIAVVDFSNPPAAGLYQVFPNPFGDFINVVGTGDYQATIFTATGQPVGPTLHVFGQTGNRFIKTSHLAPGIYFLVLTTTGGTVTKRIIKQ